MRGIVMFLVFSILVLSTLTGYQLMQARQTHAALCAIQHKELVANQQAREILKDSPAGLRDRRGNIVIEAALLQRGIDQRQDTIDALRNAGLDCD